MRKKYGSVMSWVYLFSCKSVWSVAGAAVANVVVNSVVLLYTHFWDSKNWLGLDLVQI